MILWCVYYCDSHLVNTVFALVWNWLACIEVGLICKFSPMHTLQFHLNSGKILTITILYVLFIFIITRSGISTGTQCNYPEMVGLNRWFAGFLNFKVACRPFSVLPSLDLAVPNETWLFRLVMTNLYWGYFLFHVKPSFELGIWK